MERKRMAGPNQRGAEKMVLLIFTAYDLVIGTAAIRNSWETWVPFVLFAICGFLWTINITEYKTFPVRANITAFLIQVVVFIYAIHSESYEQMLPSFFALSILIALYGLSECMYITFVAIILITLHTLFFKTTGVGNVDEISQVLRQAFSVVTYELIAIFWVRKREQSLKHTTAVIEALQRAEHSKDDFLANVSHEVRTPLNTIMGMSEIILQEQDMSHVKENVYMIQSAGRTLMSTVSDILDFSELQSEKLTIEEEVYHLSSTVQDIVNMAVAQKNGKKLELIVNVDPTLPRTLSGDEKKIRRAVMNIVNNAIKFTESGYVGIRVTGRRESYGINLVFTITDTGIGMNEENVEKLFTSFNQVDTRRNRQEGGVGLGLAISKLIVESMGGVITVRSKPGKGSSVRLVIPQKVLYDAPIVELEKIEEIHALGYLDIEQFGMPEIRDAYQDNIVGMVEQMGIDCHLCRNIEELERRFERNHHNYIFTSSNEYERNKAYFDELAGQTQIVVIVDPGQEISLGNPAIVRMNKPCYVLPIAALRNQTMQSANEISIDRFSAANQAHMGKKNSFVAPSARVLVVDDNQMNIRVIEGLLSRYQIRVTQALSGPEALEKIESMDYDFVFMDHMMPEMDGVETYHRIRGKAGSYYQKVPIIALTANAIAGSREMFLKEGFADFLEKPVELSVLERVLKRNIPEEKLITDYIPEAPTKQFAESSTSSQSDKESEKRAVQQEEKKEVVEQGDLVIGNLNVKNALLYCGSEDSYLFILEECCRNFKETYEELQNLFADQNWKNYGIKIHALKSTMRSIGADACADSAYELEMATKQDQIALVMQKHDAAMKLYQETMLVVVAHPRVNAKKDLILYQDAQQPSEVQEVTDSLEQLSDEDMKQLALEFENAMYSLDRETMENILTKLDQCQYKETALKSKLEKVHRKVTQADYFSAGELLAQIVEQLS